VESIVDNLTTVTTQWATGLNFNKYIIRITFCLWLQMSAVGRGITLDAHKVDNSGKFWSSCAGVLHGWAQGGSTTVTITQQPIWNYQYVIH